MIEVKNICKAYDKENVLNGLSCTIKDNSIYGLVGANGAGKSTLLRIITGIFNKDTGEVLIDNVNPLKNETIKQEICFVPDDLFFFSGYTLFDTALFYKAMYKKFDLDYLKKMAEHLKLDLNKKISTFSKGMKRQCAIICALATNCKYIFLDETFDGIDPIVRAVIKRMIIEQMGRQDTTLILTSHNLRELEDICDNLGLLYKGGILFESDIDTLKTHMFKLQVSFSNSFDRSLFDNLENENIAKVLSYKKYGSVATVILKGENDKILNYVKKFSPIILDILPLTLEEIFMYEMEVLGYDYGENV